MKPSNLEKYVISVGFTPVYYSALKGIIKDLWLDAHPNFEFAKMLDNLSYNVFKSFDFRITIKEAFSKKKAEKIMFKCQRSVSFISFRNLKTQEPKFIFHELT